MGEGADRTQQSLDRERGNTRPELPAPTLQFRRRAWLGFQRALDPLAPPKPLPPYRRLG